MSGPAPLIQAQDVPAYVAATGFGSSFLWLPSLAAWNQIATLILTILGIGIAVVTLWNKLQQNKLHRKEENDD
jgi:hypothetical protein